MKPVFENEIWKVYWKTIRGVSRIVVENVTSGRTDLPVMRRDGKIDYGYPEWVPQYIKDVVYKAMHK